MTDDDFKAYSVPEGDAHPANYVAELLKHEEHAHLKENEIRIEYLFSNVAKRKGGKSIVGAVHEPTVQGKLKDLFDQMLSDFFGGIPDYIMIIDAVWWSEADDYQREALCWHELCHVKQEVDQFGELKFKLDGSPKYSLREHDVAAFHSEVARYGAWSADLQQFSNSIKK